MRNSYNVSWRLSHCAAHAFLVIMPMMNIRKVGVGVFDRFVDVRVGVGFVAVPVCVRMLVMRIVAMRMFVFQK